MKRRRELPGGRWCRRRSTQPASHHEGKSQARNITAGAKKVVISAPAGKDLKTIVYSVNEKTLSAEDQIISCRLCTN